MSDECQGAQALRGLAVHDHICLIYESEEEQFETAIPFLAYGLEQGNRCMYVADEHSSETVVTQMRANIPNVDMALTQERLAVLSKADTYFQGGFFHPDRMVEFLKQGCLTSKRLGFSALRATGEMTWQLDSAVSVDQLLEYEAKLNDFFESHDAIGLCQYNMLRFQPAVLQGVLATHPLVIYKGTVCPNHYYVPPQEWLAGQGDACRYVRWSLRDLLWSVQREQGVWNALELLEASQTKLEDQLREFEAVEKAVTEDATAAYEFGQERPPSGLDTSSYVQRFHARKPPTKPH